VKQRRFTRKRMKNQRKTKLENQASMAETVRKKKRIVTNFSLLRESRDTIL
jgi:hypothetical protein